LRPSIVAFPFDLTRMATSGNAFSARALRRVLPIPEDVYGPACADLYLCPLVGLFGLTVFLNDVGGGYRLHGTNYNWYERPSQTLDIASIRRDMLAWQVSMQYILQFAREEQLPTPREILSVVHAGHRMVSLKLDPAGHPIPGDTLPRVVGIGIAATKRRFDVRWPLRVMFAAWFVLMSLAPPQVAERLAELWYFPEKRRRLNTLLSMLHVRKSPHEGIPAHV
jgi:hypothetical protein